MNARRVNLCGVALSREEFSRRLFAARVLRGKGFDGHGQPAGYSRDVLGEAIAAEKERGRYDPHRIEQRSKTAAEVHKRVFQEVLRMPAGWWDDPDLNNVLGVTGESIDIPDPADVEAVVRQRQTDQRAQAADGQKQSRKAQGGGRRRGKS